MLYNCHEIVMFACVQSGFEKYGTEITILNWGLDFIKTIHDNNEKNFCVRR